MTFVQLISYVINGVRTLTVSGMGKGNTRSAGEIAPFGYDGGAVKGLTALYVTTGNNSDRAIVGYINTNQLAEIGENRIYWTDADGNEVGKIWGHTDGTVEIAGTSGSVNVNHATQYEAMANVFATWKGLMDIQLTAIAAAASTTYTAPTLDLTPAQAKKILIP